MKTFMLTTALVAATTVTAAAQDLFRTAPDPMSIRASEFIGMRIYAAEAAIDATEYAGAQVDWQDIGEINDVILDRDGSINAVLIDVGGFLGMGERQVALSMSEVRFVSDSSTAEDPNDFFLVVNATRATVEAAPPYAAGNGSMEAPAEATATAATAPDAAKAPMMAVEGFTAVDLATLTAESLIGATVYGLEDNNLGEVSDVRIGEGDKIDGLIVDVGGFLGIGSKPVAVMLDKAQILKDADGTEIRIYVPMTTEDLTAMPAVERS